MKVKNEIHVLLKGVVPLLCNVIFHGDLGLEIEFLYIAKWLY